MRPDLEDLTARGFSLARPWAGAVVRGPCRIINLESVPKMEPGGNLVVIHARAQWSPDDAEGVRELWPECPEENTPAAHPSGLIGVGLIQRIEWLPGAAVPPADGWSLGPWCITLQDIVAFSKPMQCDGYPGLFPLGERLAAHIAKAWSERPL